MGTGDESWLSVQRDRISSETVLAMTLATLTLWGVVSSRPLIAAGFVLGITTLARNRALHTGEVERVRRKITQTNPLIEQLSLVIGFYTIAVIAGRFELFTTNLHQIVGFIAGCAFLVAIHLSWEMYSTGEYFDWWAERALRRGTARGSDMWLWAGAVMKRFSDQMRTPKERRQARSKRRLDPDGFTLSPGGSGVSDFQWRWLPELIKNACGVGRLLACTAGWALLLHAGLGIVGAATAALSVSIFSSLLADHVKYYYRYKPLREGHTERPDTTSLSGRLIGVAGSYWVSILIAFITLYWAL